jgi:hypothetical protein
MHLINEALRDENLVAKGNDSHVYRVGDKAIKVYTHLKLEVVESYLDALASANQFIQSYSPQRPIVIFSTPYEIQFQAIRVEAAGILDGKPYTVSHYSPYPNLDVLTWPATAFHNYMIFSGLDGARSDVQFLYQLNRMFCEERPTRTYDEFIYAVDILSRSIDITLGQKGNYIGKYNTKIIPNLEERKLVLQVTDTAVYIDRMIL